MLGALSGIGNGPASSATAVATPVAKSTPPLTAIGSPELTQIRYAATWPRGWMAAAVPQRVREFNVQTGKAQLTLQFLERLSHLLTEFARALKYHMQLPSAAGAVRAEQAFKEVKGLWSQRYALTWASLDECLQWSPTQAARKRFEMRGWNVETLEAQQTQDRELVSFCLMGLDSAHGAWLAQFGRTSKANLFAFAAAMAPLSIHVERTTGRQLILSVEERRWPVVQERFMVRGNGRRFPAGQWIAPTLFNASECVSMSDWAVEAQDDAQATWNALELMQERVRVTAEQVRAFQETARSSLEIDSPSKLKSMHQFAQAFCASGESPNYSWMQAVLPAVRTISRRRVNRLLRAQGVSNHAQEMSENG